MSQPTLSAQLKKLEDYLGVQLIERQPKQVTLTAAGEEIVARARRILEASDEVRRAGAQRIAIRSPAGCASRCCRPSAPICCRAWRARMRKALPRLELHAVRVSDRADARETACGRDRSSASWHCRWTWTASNRALLYEEPFTVAMPAHHRLARQDEHHASTISKDETLLLLEDGHCLRDQALEVCSRVGVHEKQDFRATSLETLRQMVAAGAGITLLPELAGRGAYGNARGVVMRPFAKPVPRAHHRRGLAQDERAACRPSKRSRRSIAEHAK